MVELMAWIIIGTGGFSIELAGLIKGAGLDVMGFIGPNPSRTLPGEHLGDDEAIRDCPSGANILIAVGDPSLRRSIANCVKQAEHKLGTFLHPKAWVADTAIIGEGVVVYPNATVHAEAHLGAGTIVNSNSSVGHESKIGAFCNIGPGVSLGGNLSVGDGTYFGIGASVVEELTISGGTIIGAGSTVVNDIAEPGTYVGTPARRRIDT
jgi:sugar O-acyltransferase (sialic acid O-acetyltransferase NeuD family)